MTEKSHQGVQFIINKTPLYYTTSNNTTHLLLLLLWNDIIGYKPKSLCGTWPSGVKNRTQFDVQCYVRTGKQNQWEQNEVVPITRNAYNGDVCQLVLLFHHLVTVEERFLFRSSKGAYDIFQHLYPSNVHMSKHIPMSKFSSSQTIIQIPWFAAGTFRGHILFQIYNRHMKTRQANINKISFKKNW